MMKFFFVFAFFILNFSHVYMQYPDSPSWKKIEQCWTQNRNLFENALQTFFDCQKTTFKDVPFAQFNPGSVSFLKKFFKQICTKIDLLKCARKLYKRVENCFDSDLKNTSQYIFAAVNAGRNHLCEQDGVIVADLISVPENQQCLSRLFKGKIDTRGECLRPIEDIQMRFDFRFTEKNCQRLDFARDCYVEELEKKCVDERGLIDFASNLYSKLLNATPCNEVLKTKGDQHITKKLLLDY